MSSNYNHLVTLRPLENYFFGGERTFRNNEDEEKVNYFAYSNLYPQQTSLLGLMRYVLLEQNDLLPLHKHKEKARELIGAESFKALDTADQSFGAIKKLSPLFIKKDDQFYRFAHPQGNLELELSDGNVWIAGGKKAFIPSMEDFDPKNSVKPSVINPDGEKIPLSDIFLPKEQVGIEKHTGDESKEDSFFRQKFYRLADGFEFAIWVEVGDSYVFNNTTHKVVLRDTIVQFGGEQKQFFLELQPAQGNFPEALFQNEESGRKITLLSDACVSEKIFDHCDFALSDTQDFRTVVIGYNEKFDYQRNKLNLLKRGSVLFIKEGEIKESKALLDNSHYQSIGFNHYFCQNI